MSYLDSIPVNISLDDFSIDDDILNKIASSIETENSYLKIPDEIGYFYRVSTIQDGNSFLHCILKMLNREYNSSNFKKRIKMAKKFRKELVEYSDDEKLNSNDELSEKHYAGLITEILKININLYKLDGDSLILIKSYNYPRKPYKRQTFCLLKNTHKTFEPIGFLDDHKFYFNFSSQKI